MTNSDPPYSPEENWTTYLDGKLSAQDAAAFEREHPEATADREMHTRILRAVRLHSPAPELRNPEFFNERILREISPAPAAASKPARSLWPLWRLAFASACCLLITGAIYLLFVRGNEGGAARDYLVQVVSVKAGDEQLDATVLDAYGLAVVWIDGLDQLPDDYVLQ